MSSLYDNWNTNFPVIPFAEKIRTWQELHVTLVWTPTWELVSSPRPLLLHVYVPVSLLTCLSIKIWHLFVFCHRWTSRTKPKGWSRVSWLYPYVFPQRKVSLCYTPHSTSFLVLFHCDDTWKYLVFSLPWQGLKAGNKKQKYERISEKKVSTSIEVKILFHKHAACFPCLDLIRILSPS